MAMTPSPWALALLFAPCAIILFHPLLVFVLLGRHCKQMRIRNASRSHRSCSLEGIIPKKTKKKTKKTKKKE